MRRPSACWQWSLWRRTLRGPPMVPPSPLLREIPEGPSITESFEDSNVRTRGRAEAGFEHPEDHLRGVEQKAYLVPDAAFVHSFKTTACSHVSCQSNPSLPGPQEELGVNPTPVRRDRRCGPLVTPERDGRIFRPNAGPTSQYLPWFAVSHDLLGGLRSPRNSCSMEPCSSRPPYSQFPFQELES
ncbi:hypothetical protein GWK47_032531 [Chionoecetes opilio]|uniref:Uncharacterized protein n=1 Tax=Chionoecetes opilio TaxID=41210 RepID=A0A8J4YIQ3_CHIOP|nr:hypothetical protein GWK47_032531 [Chionoecetes opilio]